MPAVAIPSNATIECLSRLVEFDTTTRNSNLALIDWASELLRAAGARLRYSYDDKKSKANLFASFGDGPGGVVLSGHTDVVPVDGQIWTSNPFKAAIRNGRLYGRGACDMKAFLGVVLSKLDAIAAGVLREPVHIALTYDEEAGCLGVPRLLRDIQDAGIQPSGCIVGEPTDMRVVTAHKGGRIFRCDVTGVAAHSSLTPSGVNAVEYAARIISHIQDLADKEEREGARDEGYEVPFSTISTNMIHGGTAGNIIPAGCQFHFEYRFLPGVSPDIFISSIEKFAREQVLPRMRAKDPRAGVEFHCLGVLPALDTRDTDEIATLALALAGDTKGKVAYGTEAPFFQNIGVPSVVCGPGSIRQAHQPDEYVELTQLAACERFIDRLLLALAR